jgi:hypothetical protein
VKRLLFVVGLLLLLAALYLWSAQPADSAERIPAPGSYVCAGGDTLSIAGSSAAHLQVDLPSGTVDTLDRAPAATGTLYVSARAGTMLWTKENTVLVQRNGLTRLHGCRSDIDSAHADALPAPPVWFRSPTGPHGYGFTLRYPRTLQIKQPRLHHTRFQYAAPANEPPALTEGFGVSVRLVDRSPHTPLLQFANEQIAETKRVGGALQSPIRDTTHRSREALFWRQESAMGTSVRILAVALGDNVLARVSTSTVGRDTSTYDRVANDLIRSLQFRKRPTRPPSSTTVPLAFLRAPDGPPDRGCDDVVFVPHRVPRTATPLSVALDTLFAIERDSVGPARHFLARTNETLSLDHVYVNEDTAHVYLEGRLSGLRGVCDNPRAKIQIEETARRVSGAKSVVLYRNGTRTALQPGGRGTSPRGGP